MGKCQQDSTTAGIVLLRATDEDATAFNQVATFRNSGALSIAPTADTKETTNSDDEWKTYRKTLKDGGVFSPSLDFKPDDPAQLLMKADWDDRACPWPYMILNPNNNRGIRFDGLLITSWGQEMNFSENEVTRSVGFKISGAVTETNTLPVIEAISQ